MVVVVKGEERIGLKRLVDEAVRRRLLAENGRDPTCAACGMALDNYTPGCDRCQARGLARLKRKLASEDPGREPGSPRRLLPSRNGDEPG